MLSQFPEMHQHVAHDKLSVLLRQSHTTLYTHVLLGQSAPMVFLIFGGSDSLSVL